MNHTNGLCNLFPCPPKGFTHLCPRSNLKQCSFAISGETAGKRTGRGLIQGLYPLAWEPHLSSGPCLGCTAAMPMPGHVPRWSWPTDLFFCLDLRPASLLWTCLVITRFLPDPGPNLPHSKLSPVLSVSSIRENRSSSLHYDSQVFEDLSHLPLEFFLPFAKQSSCSSYLSCILELTNPHELSCTQLFIFIQIISRLWSHYNL